MDCKLASLEKELANTNKIINQLISEKDTAAAPTPSEAREVSSQGNRGKNNRLEGAVHGARGGSESQGQLTRTQIVTIVSKTVNDKSRRQRNIIVTGLPELSPEGDIRAFTALCEEHLTIKPVLSALGVKRLGKVTAGTTRHRRLLVHLESESAATELLRTARQLRFSNDPYISSSIFINADLSIEDQKVAFDKRVQRRARHSAAAQIPSTIDAPLGLPATHTLSASSVNNTIYHTESSRHPVHTDSTSTTANSVSIQVKPAENWVASTEGQNLICSSQNLSSSIPGAGRPNKHSQSISHYPPMYAVNTNYAPMPHPSSQGPVLSGSIPSTISHHTLPQGHSQYFPLGPGTTNFLSSNPHITPISTSLHQAPCSQEIGGIMNATLVHHAALPVQSIQALHTPQQISSHPTIHQYQYEHLPQPHPFRAVSQPGISYQSVNQF
jgi:hypothetical protein